VHFIGPENALRFLGLAIPRSKLRSITLVFSCGTDNFCLSKITKAILVVVIFEHTRNSMQFQLATGNSDVSF